MTLRVQCRIWKAPGFSLDLSDVEGICSPIWGDKVLMGGPLRGDIDIMGDLTLIDYIIHWKYCYCCYCYVSVNSKTDHPTGEFFERVNSPRAQRKWETLTLGAEKSC